MLHKVVPTKITIIWTTVSLNAYFPYYWAKSKYIRVAELVKNRSVCEDERHPCGSRLFVYTGSVNVVKKKTSLSRVLSNNFFKR